MLDLLSRRVIGWAMADHMLGELTLAALRMAIACQRPEPGPIAQSDRGVQYAAKACRTALADIGALASMSCQGDPFDNARWRASSKPSAKLVDDADDATHAEARRDVFAFLEA